MDLVFIDPFQRAHLLAVIESGVKPRLVLIFPKERSGPPQEVQATMVCPRSRKCGSCGFTLRNLAVVNVGLIQIGSPIEVQRVWVAETAAPAASSGFPEGSGV